MRPVQSDEVPAYDLEFTADYVPSTEATLFPTVSLEEAGLEEATRSQPSHGFQSVPDYVAWWSDGEDARWESN